MIFQWEIEDNYVSSFELTLYNCIYYDLNNII